MTNRSATKRFLTGVAAGLFGLAISSTSYAGVINAEMELLSPTPTVYTFEQLPIGAAPTGDFTYVNFTGLGAATGGLTPVDLALGGTEASSTSGCEASDFAGFTAGNIALVQRGACFFQLKRRTLMTQAPSVF